MGLQRVWHDWATEHICTCVRACIHTHTHTHTHTISKGQRKIYSCQLFEVNSLRKRLEAYCQVLARTNSKFFAQPWAFADRISKGSWVVPGMCPQAPSICARVDQISWCGDLDGVLCQRSFVVLSGCHWQEGRGQSKHKVNIKAWRREKACSVWEWCSLLVGMLGEARSR